MTLREYHAALAEIAEQVGWGTEVALETYDEFHLVYASGPEVRTDTDLGDVTVVVLR